MRLAVAPVAVGVYHACWRNFRCDRKYVRLAVAPVAVGVHHAWLRHHRDSSLVPPTPAESKVDCFWYVISHCTKWSVQIASSCSLSVSISVPLCHSVFLSISQSINQSINQSISQSLSVPSKVVLGPRPPSLKNKQKNKQTKNKQQIIRNHPIRSSQKRLSLTSLKSNFFPPTKSALCMTNFTTDKSNVN